MQLTSEEKSQITIYRKYLNSHKAAKYNCPTGGYVCFEWKDKFENIWTSQAYKVAVLGNMEKQEKEYRKHFLDFLSRQNS